MNRRQALLIAVSVGLFSLGLARVLWSPGPATRRISVEGVFIPSVAVGSGDTLVQQASWTPPDDVYVVGWAPSVGAPDSRPDLYLSSGDTVILRAQPRSHDPLLPVFFPSGTGFLVRKGEPVSLRLRITNSGPAGQTQGASALIYFHPVAWR